MHKSSVLAVGTHKDLALKAENKCFKIHPPDGMPSRILQAKMLDDKENIIDAVPEGGEVRFIIRSEEAFNNIKKIDSNLKIEKIKEKLFL